MKIKDILRWALTIFALGFSIWGFVTVMQTRSRMAISYKDLANQAVESANYSNQVARQAMRYAFRAVHERDSVIQILQNTYRHYSESGEMLDGNEPVPLKAHTK